MSSDGDVLGKADALLRKHSIAAPATGSDTGGVPILTDLVEAPVQPIGEGEPAELAREIFTRVMAEVEGRFAADLEHRLTHQLVAEVHTAVASAVGDLRQELANAIGDAVTEALERRQIK
jgi:hypothetical protein